MLIARPEYSRSHLFKLTLEQVVEFCTINKLPPPKVRVMLCRSYGFFQPNATGGYIGINAQACRMPVFEPKNPRLQSFPGNKTDRTVAGVLAHEVGHYVDMNWRSEFNLAIKFSKIIGVENSVSSYDGIAQERVAEAMRLFILNPNLLKEGRPMAYAILRECLQPVHDLPWRLMFHYTKKWKATYIKWCESWISKSNVVTKEAKWFAESYKKHPVLANRYIVGR